MTSSPMIFIFHDKPRVIKTLVSQFKTIAYDQMTVIQNVDDNNYKINRYTPSPWSFFTSRFSSSNSLATWLKPLVMQNEWAIALHTPHHSLSKAIQIIQNIDEPLAFFILSEDEHVEPINSKEMLPQMPVGIKDLEKQAAGIAHMRHPVSYAPNQSRNFLKRVHYISDKYQNILEKLNDAASYNENNHLSADWLLENAYTVKQSINEITKNLPEAFFRELHYIDQGSQKGVPVIYPLASRLIATTDGNLTSENIQIFLKAYQSESPLTIGELWALPLVLQIRLLECLVDLTKTVLERVKQNQLADFWANRILNALRREPDKLYPVLTALSKDMPKPSPYFADQLLIQLSDAETASNAIKSWLQNKVGEDLAESVHLEQISQTAEQTSLGNVITSLHRIKQMNWREEFEKASIVDNILADEASKIYLKQDFDTRDKYRHVIEKLSKRNKILEWDVAKIAVELTQNAEGPYKDHVGFYLIDSGLKILQNKLEYIPNISERLKSLLIKNEVAFYFLSWIFVAGLLFAFSYSFLSYETHTPFSLWLLTLLALFPLSEGAIQIINFVIAHFSPPSILPKLSIKEEIPAAYRTLVVVPTLLGSEDNVKKEIEKIEIHYLANTSKNLYFALATDCRDADMKETPEDRHLLQIAIDGIRTLNEKYPGKCFYLFHRPRLFNESEGTWMGWERKRGKLEHLNRFLMGDSEVALDEFLTEGDPLNLVDMRYVLTVDSDTQLPKDSVKRLIETLGHPLNAAQINPQTQRLSRGYTIIQPRVSTNYLSANTSWFSRLFSDPSGVDPYSKSVSDIYQDIFEESVYHGKGIYDLKAFHSILSGRFPENQILSHDLLEGAFVRTAFASDIELHDTFPENYVLFCKRQQRWIRGDWQIAGWLHNKIYNAKGILETNPLSFINKWKIFDNLRRSLVPIASVTILLLSWTSHSPGPWTTLIAAIITLPVILQTIDIVYASIINRITSVWLDLRKGALRAIVNFIFIPHQAWVNLDAIVRALYRTIYSRKHLLQWMTFNIQPDEERQNSYQQLYTISLSSILIGIILYYAHPESLIYAFPFLIFWIIAPGVCKLLETKYQLGPDYASDLSPISKQYIRFLARKTWRYFDDYTNDESNWLPPDNYQEKLRVEVAYRTSPTNIGFYLMSLISAHKFGYISTLEYLSIQHKVLETLNKLERYEGHFLNWYDIKTLQPLNPRYVSTVDSGNLLASLWTSEEKSKALLKEPVFDLKLFRLGLNDTLELFFEACADAKIEIELKPLTEAIDQFVEESILIPELFIAISNLSDVIEKQIKLLEQTPANYEVSYWINKLLNQVDQNYYWIEKTLSWASILVDPHAEKILLLHPEGVIWKNEALSKFPSLEDILNRGIPGLIFIFGWVQTLSLDKLTQEEQEWIIAFVTTVNQAFAFADSMKEQVDFSLVELQKTNTEMNLHFLFNESRKLFAIGYNVSEKRLDSSFYDLLASEARLTSFVAIARGDVPIEHWWALGRPLNQGYGMVLIQSWGGTMFEYLMPVIWCRNYKNTLLDYACKVAVKCQISYAKQRGIPWGISESAYSGLDIHNIYQYRAFGVPYLGLKRGLENDLVVTPYSSAMALMVDPSRALANIKWLDFHEKMNGTCGLYEAIDYSRKDDPQGKRGVIIHAYMAHHMGMSLTSYCNTLEDGYLQCLFHSHPRVRASETILYERPQIGEFKETSRQNESPFPKLSAINPVSALGQIDTALTPRPITHLLSNGSYSVMITNAGSGYSKFHDIDITRWRADSTCDALGMYFYIKDLDRNASFSAAYQPTKKEPTGYFVTFSNHLAEIRRKDLGIETVSEIAVSAEDNVEIRCITLGNLSMRNRHLEITSYAEIVLAEHKADAAHLTFSKMFVSTEAVHSLEGLLATRRKRAPEDIERWCFHVAAISEEENSSTFTFETSREQFIGRNRDLSNPYSLDHPLSQTEGFVLDPIFSIRKKITLEPGKRIKISYVTGYANTREEALKLMEKYRDINASSRLLDMAWTHAELDLRRLHISQDDARLFQRLANMMIYPDSLLRASQDRIRRNRLTQENLWVHGISGDNPILLITIEDTQNLDIVQEALRAHAFWRMRGLKTDLVILNQEKSGYDKPLNDSLTHIVQGFIQYTGWNTNGGIFLLATDILNYEEQNLLFTVAYAVIVAERGTISQHLAMPRRNPAYPSLMVSHNVTEEEPTPLLPFMELLNFNGIGGFTKDGKEYAIYLDHHNPTPSPWINAISNSHFGFLASETGLGMTWSLNSQMNRLSPWSNDPVINPIADVCYIRDDDSGEFWTVTARPINENSPYRARHGQGYTVYEHNSHGIEQEMIVFTPLDEFHTTAKVQIVKLINRSKRTRTLSVFAYVELTLGLTHEESQRYIVSSWNQETNTLYAFNHYRSQFAERVTFMTCDPAPTSYTGSRKEFIGRNGSLQSPDALFRSQLSGSLGAALDPCFALQTTFEIEPNETIEIIFTLGEASHILKAKEICRYYQSHDHVNHVLELTKSWWDDYLNKIQVSCPDKSVNLFFNRWLTYQNLSCRNWGRSAFYQSGGAFGFRDQLQDVAALVYFDPKYTRDHILLCASRQFVEGDVQHWWHPGNGMGVRTRITDDLLWLPYVAMHYIKVTGDTGIMNEIVPYIEGKLLGPNEHEIIIIPTVSEMKGTLQEHCIKAIDKALHYGPHGIPLIGTGDWNDGMNCVGIEGKGESVWLGWLLVYILREFGGWLKNQGQAEKALFYKVEEDRIYTAIQENGWDGEWYIRAFFDDGSPIGSHLNSEDKIDSLPQSWAAINEPFAERTVKAMESVERHLIDKEYHLTLLFTPPFDHYPKNPGYIQGYPPGVRENGGQYTHAALWVALALARRGQPEKALEVIHMINPINRTSTRTGMEHYKVEPYVTSADIYSLEGQRGRGGWTWYTGSASWSYRVLLEEIFGFKLEGEHLLIDPVIPKDWDGFELTYRHNQAVYKIKVENPQHITKGVVRVEVDGKEVNDKKIKLESENKTFAVRVLMG